MLKRSASKREALVDIISEIRRHMSVRNIVSDSLQLRHRSARQFSYRKLSGSCWTPAYFITTHCDLAHD